MTPLPRRGAGRCSRSGCWAPAALTVQAGSARLHYCMGHADDVVRRGDEVVWLDAGLVICDRCRRVLPERLGDEHHMVDGSPCLPWLQAMCP